MQRIHLHTLKQIFFSSLAVSAALLFGRMSGFVRDISLASYFGINQHTDFALILLIGADFLMNLLVGGAFSAVLIPALCQLPRPKQRLMFTQSLLISASVSILIASLISIYPRLLLNVLAPGFSPLAMQQIAPYLSEVIWALPLSVIACLTTAWWQTHQRFALPAYGTLIFNCTILLFIFTSGQSFTLEKLVVAILLGATLRLVSQLLRLPGQAFKVKNWEWLLSKELLKQYLQVIISASLLLFLPIYINSLATHLGKGMLTLFNYAYKLTQLPLTVGLSVLSIILLPKLSALQKQKESADQLSQLAVQVTFVLSIIATSLLFQFSDFYIQLLFSHTEIASTQSKQLIMFTRILLLSLPAQALLSTFKTIYNAKQRNLLPLVINCAFIALLIISFGLIKTSVSASMLLICESAIFYAMALAQGWMLQYRFQVPILPWLFNRNILGVCLLTLTIVSIGHALSAHSHRMTLELLGLSLTALCACLVAFFFMKQLRIVDLSV